MKLIKLKETKIIEIKSNEMIVVSEYNNQCFSCTQVHDKTDEPSVSERNNCAI